MRWAANPSTACSPAVRGEEPQRGDGQVVVAVPEPGPAGVGEQVLPGRAAPAAGAAARCVADLGLARRRSARRGAGGRRAPTAPARPATAAAVHGPCSISSRATAARVRPSDGPPRRPAPASPVHPGPGDGARVQSGTGPLLFTTPVLPISRDRQSDPSSSGRGRVRGLDCRTRSIPCGHVAGRAGHPTAGARLHRRWRCRRDAASTVRDPARIPRRLGLTGALLMGIGALGAGALPVPNPLFGLRVISLPGRNATAAIAITYAGMGMLVLAWLWIGRMLRGPRAVAPAPDRTQLARTGLLWALPLALAPPMFSKDVYSYLAQSAITARGLDPYSLGPAAALGVDDPLTRTIPTIWRDTPAPYGPLFLMLGRGITALTGYDVVQGVFAHRVLALCGVALIIWALPRLARRCGLDAGLVALARRGEPAGAVPPGQRHPQRGPDDRADARRRRARAARPGPRPGFLRDPRFVLGAVVVVAGGRGQAAGAAGARVRRDGRGAAAGRPGARRRRGRRGAVRGRGRGLRRARRRQRAGLRLDAARSAPRT